jgi:hypothetical protein
LASGWNQKKPRKTRRYFPFYICYANLANGRDTEPGLARSLLLDHCRIILKNSQSPKPSICVLIAGEGVDMQQAQHEETTPRDCDSGVLYPIQSMLLEFYYNVTNQHELFICSDLMIKNREIYIKR